MLLGMRLGKFACLVAVLAAFLGLAGFALAHQLGVAQTRHTSVACLESRPTFWQTLKRDGRAVCVGKPLRRRGVSHRATVVRGPSQTAPPPAPADPTGRAGVTPGVPTDPGGLTLPTDTSEDPGSPPGDNPPLPGENKPETPPADTTPPDTSIASGPPATTAATTVSLAFSSSEPESTFECKLDGGGWKACISPKGYSSLAVGAREFSVRAIDAAHNVDPTPASWSWTIEASAPPVDNIPPQTSITGGPLGTTTATSANFTLASTETGSSFECKLDEENWAACSMKTSYTELEAGSHQFAARAIDAAENVDSSPATRSWEIEETPEPPPTTPPAQCTTSVTSTSAAQSAVSAATGGSVVCLADGSYGELSISANKSSQVTVQAEHPGRATIAGASLSGSHLTLAYFNINNEVTVEPGASSMAVEYNRISGGYMGINAGPTSSTSISDTTIRGNKLVGPFGEDALRINRYHDGSDVDPYGILIEGNEITGVRENGNHSDCLQSVWGGDGLYFRRNYLHDNRCQGFFVKDQPGSIVGITVEDNLFLRNSEPCAPEASGCGQPSYLQIFGPYQNLTMRRNTVWQGEVVASFQEGTGVGTTIEANVVNRFWTNTNLSGIAYLNNTVCKREDSAGGSWPAQVSGETISCSPAFANPSIDDYRLSGSDRGVDWAPREQHYGP